MNRILFISLVMIVSLCFISVLDNTYAYSYDIEKGILFYKENSNELEIDISKYIGYIDDYIIANSSYEMSEYLDENYDFLVNFANDYVINNREYYSEYIYDDNVRLNIIYDITDKYFGIRDFYIEDISKINNLEYISLVDYNEKRFSLAIKDVDIINDSKNYVSAIISYDNNIKYKYLFKNINGVLKIRNIEVVL